MEHIVEAVMELLFGFFKKKPGACPQVELKEEFLVHYQKSTSLISLTVCFLGSVLFFVLSFFVDSDTKILFYIFSSLFIIVCFLFLFLFSTRCRVTTEKLEKTVLFFFKKNILWKDISCLRIIEKDDESSLTFALYNYDKCCVLDLFSDMENAWHIVEMAKAKGIEIRNEKNLTVKQMKKL